MERGKGKPWNFHTCKFCPYRSKSTHVICKHIELHRTRSKTDTFVCALKTPEVLECELCEFDTSLRVDLAAHFRIFHEGKENNKEMVIICKCYRCKSCDFQTHSLLVLTKHVCDCKPRFCNNPSEGLRRSPRKRTEPSKTRNDKWSEFVSPEGVKWCKCIQCAYKTIDKGNMKKHILWKHTDPSRVNWFKCEQCSHKTKDKYNLKAHVMAKHTNPENINWRKCTQCSFKTKYSGALQEHMFGKHADFWFNCDKCEFKTKYTRMLKEHVQANHLSPDKWYEFRSPEGVKWRKCKHCVYKTVHKYNMRKHVCKRS